jgi:hypothetical protein
MPPAPRGSATLPARQLAELRKIAESTGKLVYWFPRGQPNPDAILGVVIAPRDRLGGTIDKIAGVKGTNLRFDVFPLGIPFPEEFLVSFEQGFGGMH